MREIIETTAQVVIAITGVITVILNVARRPRDRPKRAL
jgi:hypothetical protein